MRNTREIQAWLDEAHKFVQWQTITERDALEIIRELLEDRKWQPIETAPKDNRELFLRFPGSGDFARGWWNSTPLYGEPRWQNITGGSFCYEPTHWMPLPEPPSTDTGTE